MTNVFVAETLDDALEKLSESVKNRGAENGRSLVFCEDRITLLAERAVLKGTGGGTFTAEVSTFARYLSQKNVERISKEGSVMKISELILDGRSEDGCFNGGSARAVYETIAQLSASGVDAEMLLAAAGTEEAEGMLGRKLKDLARIYGAYRAFLRGSGRVDENGYLALLKEAIEEDALDNTHVYFFAFPSFTKQAMEGVQAAFSRAKSVTGIFLGGREGIYTNRAATRFIEYAERAEGAVSKARVPCSLPQSAKLVRDCLFTPSKRKREDRAKTDSVFVFEAEDETREAEKVAALVKKKIAEGARFCDLAVLVPGEEYFLTVEKVFSAYGVPFYSEKKRKLSTHPFAVYVLSVLEAVADGVLPEEADAVLSNVCFGGGDEYRNYLLRYGAFRGAVNVPVKEGAEVAEYDHEKLLDAQARIKGVLSLFKQSAKGKDYTDGIRRLFEKTNWKKVQARLETLAGEDGLSAAEKNFLSISLDEGSAFRGVLGEIELVAGERRFGAREFAVLLRNGLDALGVSMIPPCLDVVFVGDVTESRFTRVDTLFVMGLTDAVPRAGEDTAIITDGEIERLKDIKMEIEPAIAEVNRRSRESFALNLSAFERELYLSYPLQLKGGETDVSEAIRDIGKNIETAPMPALYPYDCSEIVPAQLKMAFAKPAGGYAGDGALYETLDEFFDDGERRAYKPEFTEGTERLSPNAALLWQRGGALSPTTLEDYFECPYRGFGMRGLALRERREGNVRASEAGTFVHTVLERVAKSFNEIATEEELLDVTRRTAGQLLTEARYRSLTDTRAGEFAGERLVSESCAVANAAWKQLVSSAFRVRRTEENVSLDGLNIAGKADRVDDADEYVRVVDYKTGKIEDSGIAYYTGRRLQLQLYLLAASKDKEPAGAFYFPAANVYAKEDEEKFRMKGFFCADDEVVTRFEPTLQTGQTSAVFGGTRGKFSDKGMPQEDFVDFLGYSRLVARQAEREMQEGYIGVSPYEDACTYCKLQSLCGFTDKCRKEKDVSCKDVVKIARDAKEDTEWH